MRGSRFWVRFRSAVLVAVLAAMVFSSGDVARASEPDAARSTQVQGAAGLIQQLAVLQRAQTPADVIPVADVPDVQRPRLIRSLSRLVDTVSGSKIYLIVLKGNTGPVHLWNADLGDVAELISLASSGLTNLSSISVPAAHVDDANAVGRVATTGSTQLGVQLVPNGVAQVTWTLGDSSGGTATVTSTPANNVAVAPIMMTPLRDISAAWQAADGSAIATSTAALTKAEAAENVLEYRAAVKQAEATAVTPSPKLLAAFKIFGVTSRRGVKVGSLTISHPRVSSLPAFVLYVATNDRHRLADAELDVNDVREATTASGNHIYVIPGRRGMAVSVNGDGAGTSPSLTQTLRTGMLGFTVNEPNGGQWHYGIRPNRFSTARITLKSGAHRTLKLTDGIYAYHTGP